MSQGAQEKGRILADRYRLVSVVGRGGMGTVWRAVDEVLHRDVAVKEVIVRPDLADDERDLLHHRTLREARATARLNHPGIVTVHDVVDEDGRPWIVMEFVAARSLQEVIDQDGPQSPRRVAEIGRQTLSALQAAHAVGILHRDVKPGNVLITGDGRAVLTDFGIAQVEGDTTLTHTGMIVGSPAYIAPERVRGERATGAADLWALGATLYAACEGDPPFAHTGAMAVFAAILTEDPPPPANAGPLTPVLQALLHRDPVRRMNAHTASGLLTEVANGAAPRPAPPTEPDPGLPWTGAVTDGTAPDGPAARDPWPGPLAALAQPDHQTAQLASAGGPGYDAAFDRGQAAFQPGSPVEHGQRGNPGLFVMIGVLVTVVVVLAVLLVLRPGDEKSPSGTSPSGPAGSAGTASPSQTPSTTPRTDPTLPAGWRRAQGPGGTIGVPAGWRRSVRDASVFWYEPGTGAYLQLDRTAWTGDPYEAWQSWETEVRAKDALDNYHRVDLRQVAGAPYEAADIEFTWNGRGGMPMHGVDRRIIADGKRYAVLVALPAGRWNTSQEQVSGFLDTFVP